MIFRPSRENRGDDPLLDWKMLSFAAGAVLALAGIAYGMDWLIWVAIGVLALGFVLRFLKRDRGEEP